MFAFWHHYRLAFNLGFSWHGRDVLMVDMLDSRTESEFDPPPESFWCSLERHFTLAMAFPLKSTGQMLGVAH